MFKNLISQFLGGVKDRFMSGAGQEIMRALVNKNYTYAQSPVPTSTPTPKPTATPTPPPRQFVTPKPLPTQGVFNTLVTKMVTPTPTPTPTPKPIRIMIPSSSGKGQTLVPEPAASALMKAFDKYGEATPAATVMHHPMQISGLPSEIAQGKNNFGNMGENGSFNSEATNIYNADKTIDTGLMQVNSGTFAGMMNDPYWKNALAKRGITDYSQMTDPFKNAMAAMLVLMRGNYDPQTGSMKEKPRNWRQWYAAPRNMRYE